MAQFKYISSINDEELKNNVVIPCTDEDGYPCILIKNGINKVLGGSYSTDNLDIKINRVLSRNGFDYFFHIIRAKKIDGYSKSQFDIIFDYVFSKIANPLVDVELSSLLTSLEDFFKTTPETNRREIQIGVFGELLTIKYLYDCGYKSILNNYHTNFYSKHDVEICSSLRLEIKTSTSEKRIHHFKHNQIMRDDVHVLVASVLLEESKEGLSLKEMFNLMLNLFQDPDTIFALHKLMVRCGLDADNNGMCFSYEKALQDIKFFSATNLPKIEKLSFEGITNVEYDVDCTNCESYLISDLLNVLEER